MIILNDKHMNTKISFAARSHIGLVRSNNEDNLYCDGEIIVPYSRDIPFALSGETDVPCIFAVCDGMGGEDDGEVASLVAVSTLKEHEGVITQAASTDATESAVQEFVLHANKTLCEMMRKSGRRMGTTLALIVVSNSLIQPYNIGDSRIYTLQNGQLSRVSEDHTLAAQKVRMGLITEEQAELDCDKNKLTRYLGVFEDEMTVEAVEYDPLHIGDIDYRILLCSDGLTDMVTERRIEIILDTVNDAWEAVKLLVDEALKNGGRDNVTCIIVDIDIRGVSYDRHQTI